MHSQLNKGCFFIGLLALVILCNLVSAETYPQIYLSGNKRWLYQDFDVQPMMNYPIAVQDPSWNLTGPWFEQLDLLIDGRIIQDVDLRYYLKQFPILADQYQIVLKYKDLPLVYGRPQKSFQGQRFAFTDQLKGISTGGSLNKFNLWLFSGSYPDQGLRNYSGDLQETSRFRNPDYNGERVAYSYFNDNPYLELGGLELGRIDIIGKSVEVYIGKKRLARDLDFYLSEEQGLVLIVRALLDSQEVKVKYQLNDGTSQEKSFDPKKDAQRRAFVIPEYRMVDGSEKLTVNGLMLKSDYDYTVDYNLGLIVMNSPLLEDAEVSLDYEFCYGSNLFVREDLSGQVGTIFTLQHKNLIAGSITINKNGRLLSSGTDYTINYLNGRLTLMVALVAADKVEVSYTYLGIRQNVNAAQVEYELTGSSRIGINVVDSRPKPEDVWLSTQQRSATFTVFDLFYRTAFNQDTYFKAEMAYSSGSIDSVAPSAVEMAKDSAFDLEGRTRVGKLRLNGAYRKNGLDYASVRKVKQDTGSKNEKMDIGLEYPLNQWLTLKGGMDSDVEQVGMITSPEVTEQSTFVGLCFEPLSYLNIQMDLRNQKGTLAGQTASAQKSQQLYYTGLDLNRLFPGLTNLFKELFFTYRYLSSDDNIVIDSGSLLLKSVKGQETEMGYLLALNGGASAYLSSKSSNLNDSTTALLTQSTPFLRLSYKFDLFGNQLDIYYDNSRLRQQGAMVTNYEKKDSGYGLSLNCPVENAVISKLSFGLTAKTTDYTDSANPANDYRATTYGSQGTIVF